MYRAICEQGLTEDKLMLKFLTINMCAAYEFRSDAKGFECRMIKTFCCVLKCLFDSIRSGRHSEFDI
jgi:hypothetical protein